MKLFNLSQHDNRMFRWYVQTYSADKWKFLMIKTIESKSYTEGVGY
jgi:hypothetical protein